MIKRLAVYWDNFLYKVIIKNLLKISKLGYGVVVTGAESGENFEHIYDNQPEGAFFVGKKIDKILLNLPATQATRARKDQLKYVLWNEIHNNHMEGKATKVLDLASGGARYLRELKEEHNDRKVESICVDKNIDCVNLGKRLTEKEKVKNIKFIRGDVFKLEHLKNLSKELNWSPNVMVASGIFIYFNDELVVNMLKEIYKNLPQRGLLALQSYEKLNTKKLMRKTMATSDGKDWTLYYRKPEFWRETLYEIGYKDISISRDAWQMNNICTGRKLI